MPGWGLDKLLSLGGGLVPGAPPLAIDFGSGSLKVLQLAPGGTGPATITAAAHLITPDRLAGDPHARLLWQLDELPGLLKAAGVRTRRAVCALPGALTLCKHLQVQPEPGIDINELVRADLAAQLGCAPDALVARHLEVGALSGGKTEVVALAASAGLVRRLMDGCRAARLELVGMHPECTAIVRGFDHITKRVGDADTVSLYLDIGHSGTRMFIAHGTRLVFAKSLAVGGHTLDQTLAQQTNCDLALARANRRAALAQVQSTAPVQPSIPPGVIDTRPAAAPAEGLAVLAAGLGQAASGVARSMRGTAPGLAIHTDRRAATPAAVPASPPGHTLLQGARAPLVGFVDGKRFDLSDPIDTLTDEIALCLRYHDGLFPGKRITRAIFVGGEARGVGLCQHIARVLRLPAHTADPLARLGRPAVDLPGPAGAIVKLSEPQPGWAVALGLTLCPTDL